MCFPKSHQAHITARALSFRRPFYQAAMTPSPRGYVQRPLDVPFGSKADIEARQSDVRFTPKSGLMHCSNFVRYSNTASAVVPPFAE
jgi:hypothetical protein